VPMSGRFTRTFSAAPCPAAWQEQRGDAQVR
jgi:hypothetical protein